MISSCSGIEGLWIVGSFLDREVICGREGKEREKKREGQGRNHYPTKERQGRSVGAALERPGKEGTMGTLTTQRLSLFGTRLMFMTFGNVS